MKTGLVWFRNNLRVQDNEVLLRAIEDNDRVMGIYFFDPRQFDECLFGFRKMERFRAKFLLETVSELKENLEELNISLFVYRQEPEDVFPIFLDDRNVSTIYLQKEWTSEEEQVTNLSKKVTNRYDIDWVEIYDQFLFHPDDIPFKTENTPKVFTDFRKKCEKYSKVRPSNTIQPLPSENKVENPTELPILQDLGFEPFGIPENSAFPFLGGEHQAKKRLQDYIWATENIATYKKTRNGLIGTDYSSKLSAWLANGSLSPRTVYHEIKKFEKLVKKNDSTYWLIFELIWRDFFKYISLKHGTAIFKIGGILHRDYEWNDDPKLIDNWIHGRTDEPFVNANMIELKQTGWMSNRGRQNVASYFAKELELDWRIGAAYFESLLLDYDVHSNYGNWMYVAGVGNDPRDRKFNIQLQAERYDPDGIFQNTWLENTLI